MSVADCDRHFANKFGGFASTWPLMSRRLTKDRSMHTTIYAYPWDLARMGIERSLREIADRGISAIDLAATYHPIDTYSPRDGGAFFSNARGAVYFRTRGERYGRIVPREHGDAENPGLMNVWPEVARMTASMGLALNAWTITLFMPWIRDAYPDCARILPTGQASGSGACPANPDVREFLIALCEDMVEQFGVNVIRLENVMPIFDFDWLRPRVLFAFSPVARELMNLCFCNSCMGRAKDRGIDAAGLRRRVNQAIAGEANDDGDQDRLATLRDDAELATYAELAMDGAIGLVKAIVARLVGRARVSVNAAASYAQLLGVDREEQLLASFIGAADQLELIPGHAGNAQVTAIARRLSPPREIAALIPVTRGKGLSGPAMAQAPSDLETMIQSSVDAGVTELCLYNYGLLRDIDIAAATDLIARGRHAE